MAKKNKKKRQLSAKKKIHKKKSSNKSPIKDLSLTNKTEPLVDEKSFGDLKEDSGAHDLELAEKINLNEETPPPEREISRKKYGKHTLKFRKPIMIFFKIVLVLIFLSFLGLCSLFLIFGRDLPDVKKLKDMDLAETSRIYDREGNVLYSIYGEENRKFMPLNKISKNIIHSTLAIEDKNFYSHWGFDPVGIVRAQLKNLENDKISQGASTITQQLAKNYFLNREKTYDRKIKELLLALEIEWNYSKDEILEMYLNKIPYGTNSFGVEAAAQTFFGVSSSDVSLVQAAVIASLPKAPSYYSPYGQNKKELMGYCQDPHDTHLMNEDVSTTPPDLPNEEDLFREGEQLDIATQEVKSEPVEVLPPKSAFVCNSINDPNWVWGRKDYVLKRMFDDGLITSDEMNQAWKDGLTLNFRDNINKIEAPHFVFYVRELLEQKYGKELVENGGLEVRTSLDPRLQSIAEDVIKVQTKDYVQRWSANNAGLVAVDPKNGQVLAMVGSKNYWDPAIDGQVNVTTSNRQPGSSFKPLIYATAIQNAGIGSGTILGDYRTVFNKKDVPRNSDNRYQGKMTIRTALGSSRNIPAIKAYYLAGEEEKVLDFLDKVGLKSLRQFRDTFNKDAATRGWTFFYGWPMALGSGEVRMIDLVNAYAAFANGGKYSELQPILEVRNRKGDILDTFGNVEPVQAMDPQVAYIINSMLSDNSARPAGSWRNNTTIPGHTAGVKTGTSNKKVGKAIYPNNTLTVGYTPSLAAAAWVGNTDGSQLKSSSWCIYTAAPIWKEFMTRALEGQPDEPFPEPEGIKHVGRDVFPSFAQTKNFDSQFKSERPDEDTQQKIEQEKKKKAEQQAAEGVSVFVPTETVTPQKTDPKTPPPPSPSKPVNDSNPPKTTTKPAAGGF